MQQRLVELSDAQLVLLVQTATDRNAYGELTRRHQASLRAFLSRLAGDRARADDIAQNALIRGYDRIRGFRNQASFRTWLFSIAYREFLKEQRQAARYAGYLAEMARSDETHDDRDPGSTIDIQRCLQHLEINERAAILLCDACGMSHSEAADAMGAPLGSVKTYVQRARGKMRDAMGIRSSKE